MTKNMTEPTKIAGVAKGEGEDSFLAPNEGSSSDRKKLYMKTFGCQMNVYDAERMTELLEDQGYETTADSDEADLVVLNTCHIRDKAAEKLYSEVGRLRSRRAKNSSTNQSQKIAVTGCVAQAHGELIQQRAPSVDVVAGPQSLHKLPSLLADSASHGRVKPAVDFEGLDKFKQLPQVRRKAHISSFVSVQEGCDKFCSFCVVPYTRGAEYSRSVAAVESEVLDLVDKGAREITLLGQNVNAYHGHDEQGFRKTTASLADLITRLARIGGLDRIRYTTSHPRDMHDDLIALHGNEPKLMPFLHLPIQSGSDKILDDMNRGHTVEFYDAWIEKLKQVRPDIALSSDFIVGFPGETEDDFKETLHFVERTQFALAFSFKYSPRPGTPGATKKHQVDEEVKTERLARLQAVLNTQQTSFNRNMIGRRLDILVEKKGRKTGQVQGRSPYLQSVYMEGRDDLIGKICKIEVTGASQHSLSGRLVNSDREAYRSLKPGGNEIR